MPTAVVRLDQVLLRVSSRPGSDYGCIAGDGAFAEYLLASIAAAVYPDQLK
jgi:hypothetical protein